MAQYQTGTVSTVGTAVITGSGTAFQTAETAGSIAVGDDFGIPVDNGGDGLVYQIASIDSETQITLTAAYAGANVSGVGYAITSDYTTNYSFPKLFRGDILTSAIFTRAMNLIDSTILSKANSVISSLQDGTNRTVGRKNLFRNGEFLIDQRGLADGAGYTTDGYSMDLVQQQRTGSTLTVTRQAFTVGQTDVPLEPKYYGRAVVTTSAGASNFARLRFDVPDIRLSPGNKSLGLLLKADAAKSVAIEGFQQFGTSGSAEVNTLNVTKINLTTSWQLFSWAHLFPSISGKTIGTSPGLIFGVYIWLDAGSTFNTRTDTLGQQSGTFDFANVQIERGSVATEFEKLAEDQYLDQCLPFACSLRGKSTATAPIIVSDGQAVSTTACDLVYIHHPMHTPVTAISTTGVFKLNNGITTFAVTSGPSLSAAGLQTERSTYMSVSVASGLTAGGYYRLQADNDATADIILGANP